MANIIHQHYLLPSGQLTVVVVMVCMMALVLALMLVLLLVLMKDYLPFVVLPFRYKSECMHKDIYIYMCVRVCAYAEYVYS